MLSLFIIVYKSKEKAVNSILLHKEKAKKMQIGKSTGQQHIYLPSSANCHALA
jgi:hypothetical protein